MSPGAEKPKRSTPTTLPSRPTYLYHMLVTPASMATRLVHDLGRTSCLYESGWRSKMSMHGIETTRTPSPSASAAFIACCTSEPDAMRISLRSPLSFLATYAPLRTPSRRVFTGIDLRVSTFWRVRISDVGPSMRCCECTYAPTVSSGSACSRRTPLSSARARATRLAVAAGATAAGSLAQQPALLLVLLVLRASHAHTHTQLHAARCTHVLRLRAKPLLREQSKSSKQSNAQAKRQDGAHVWSRRWGPCVEQAMGPMSGAHRADDVHVGEGAQRRHRLDLRSDTSES
eukprot:3646601-Rhodomonas_salina.1